MTYMYNVEVKFEEQEDIVVIGVEGSSEEDVYNFIPCIIPESVAYEVINITIDETTTPELERKKENRNKAMQEKYQEKYNEFLQICENMNETEDQKSLALVMDITKEDFFITELDKASDLDIEQYKIMVAANAEESE